jgi:hypothetical protein
VNVTERRSEIVLLVKSLDRETLERSSSVTLVTTTVLEAVVGGHSESDKETEGLESDVESDTLDEVRSFGRGEGESGENRETLTDTVERTENGLR